MSETVDTPLAHEPAPRPAGFWLRGLAFALDFLSYLIADYFVSGFVGLLWQGPMTPEDFWNSDPSTVENTVLQTFETIGWTMLAGLALAPLASAIFTASPLRATPGKLTTRIYVVDVAGRRLGFWRSLGREYGKLLSLATLLIGFLMAGVTREKLALHDLIVGSRVRRLPPRSDPPPPGAASPQEAPPPSSTSPPPPPRPTRSRPNTDSGAMPTVAYVFAGLGALPVLGWPFSLIALVWGLVSRKEGSKRVAGIAAICMFGLMAMYAIPIFFFLKPLSDDPEEIARMLAPALKQITLENLTRTVCHIESFRAREGRYPADLTELYKAQREKDGWLKIADPFAREEGGAPLRYQAGADGYTLFSVGFDGVVGTEDDIYPPEGWKCPEFHPWQTPAPGGTRV